MTTTQDAFINFVETLSFLLFSLLMKSVKEEIQSSNDHVDIARG